MGPMIGIINTLLHVMLWLFVAGLAVMVLARPVVLGVRAVGGVQEVVLVALR